MNAAAGAGALVGNAAAGAGAVVGNAAAEAGAVVGNAAAALGDDAKEVFRVAKDRMRGGEGLDMLNGLKARIPTGMMESLSHASGTDAAQMSDAQTFQALVDRSIFNARNFGIYSGNPPTREEIQMRFNTGVTLGDPNFATNLQNVLSEVGFSYGNVFDTIYGKPLQEAMAIALDPTMSVEPAFVQTMMIGSGAEPMKTASAGFGTLSGLSNFVPDSLPNIGLPASLPIKLPSWGWGKSRAETMVYELNSVRKPAHRMPALLS